MGKRPSSMEGREDGDGGSMKENNSEESPSDPAEPTEDKAGTTEETPATEPEAASDEQGLDAIPQGNLNSKESLKTQRIFSIVSTPLRTGRHFTFACFFTLINCCSSLLYKLIKNRELQS